MQVADYLHPITGLDHFTLNITILILGLICITPLCNAWGGAIFNPAMNMAFITSGRGSAGFNLLRAVSSRGGVSQQRSVVQHKNTLPSHAQGFRQIQHTVAEESERGSKLSNNPIRHQNPHAPMSGTSANSTSPVSLC